ncbi:MAG: hypothetical protein ABIC57_02995, partial [bacterium]
MSVDIIKKPEFENDDYLIKINEFSINQNMINKLLQSDDYLRAKYISFAEQNPAKDKFIRFRDRASLRSIDTLPDLSSSVYTYAVKSRNNIDDYLTIIETIKHNLKTYPDSRRNAVRFLNSYLTYNSSESRPIDVSCLAFIHYFYADDELNVKIVFRASDVKSELIYDVLTLYSFFIIPVTDVPVCLSLYSTTVQNITFFETFINNLNKIIEEKGDA